MNQKNEKNPKIQNIKKWLFHIVNIRYLMGIITCFICNLAIEKKLSWFFIALIGILISFSITSLPLCLKNNKYKVLKITFIITVLTYLLLFTIHFVSLGNWLLESFLIASFVFQFIWIDVLICTFTKISSYYKVSISLLLLAFLTLYTNPVCAKVLNTSNNDGNIPNFICATVMISISLGILLTKQLQKKNK